jgi:hypothetical protein
MEFEALNVGKISSFIQSSSSMPKKEREQKKSRSKNKIK